MYIHIYTYTCIYIYIYTHYLPYRAIKVPVKKPGPYIPTDKYDIIVYNPHHISYEWSITHII
jgi:hypothetical protein